MEHLYTTGISLIYHGYITADYRVVSDQERGEVESITVIIAGQIPAQPAYNSIYNLCIPLSYPL